MSLYEWMEKHPKLAIAILLLFFLLVVFALFFLHVLHVLIPELVVEHIVHFVEFVFFFFRILGLLWILFFVLHFAVKVFLHFEVVVLLLRVFVVFLVFFLLILLLLGLVVFKAFELFFMLNLVSDILFTTVTVTHAHTVLLETFRGFRFRVIGVFLSTEPLENQVQEHTLSEVGELCIRVHCCYLCVCCELKATKNFLEER